MWLFKDYFISITVITCFILLCKTGISAQTWTSKDPDMTGSLFGENVFAINEEIAWTYGIESDLFNQYTYLNTNISKTVNGGNTWSAVSFPVQDKFYMTSLWALDETNAWMTGVSQENVDSANYLFETKDGGNHWNRIPVPIEVFINFVYMWNENEGMLMGDPDEMGFEIYTTVDGGSSWTRSSNVPKELLNEFAWKDNYAVHEDELWFSTNLGRIYHTIDKGITWQVLPAPITSDNAWQMDVSKDGEIFLAFTEYVSSLQTDVFHVFKRSAENENWVDVTPEDNHYLLRDIVTIPSTNTVIVSLEAELPATIITYDDGNSWIIIDELTRINAMDFYSPEKGYGTHANLGQDLYETEIFLFAASPTSVLINNEALHTIDFITTPNPFTDILQIKAASIESEDFTIIIYSGTGQVLDEIKVNNRSSFDYSVNTSLWSSGIYTVTVTGINGSRSKNILRIN